MLQYKSKAARRIVDVCLFQRKTFWLFVSLSVPTLSAMSVCAPARLWRKKSRIQKHDEFSEWCFTSDTVESLLNSGTGCCVLTLLSSYIVYVCTSIIQLGFHRDSFLLYFHFCSEKHKDKMLVFIILSNMWHRCCSYLLIIQPQSLCSYKSPQPVNVLEAERCHVLALL